MVIASARDVQARSGRSSPGERVFRAVNGALDWPMLTHLRLHFETIRFFIFASALERGERISLLHILGLMRIWGREQRRAPIATSRPHLPRTAQAARTTRSSPWLSLTNSYCAPRRPRRDHTRLEPPTIRLATSRSYSWTASYVEGDLIGRPGDRADSQGCFLPLSTRPYGRLVAARHGRPSLQVVLALRLRVGTQVAPKQRASAVRPNVLH
jgi:hypothetical protein